MTTEILLSIGEEIQDVDEGAETFHLFSQPLPSQDLGMVDSKKKVLEIRVAGKDLEITQSPGLLQSKRGGGTTGAAVWQASVRFAEWVGSSKNTLFLSGILNADSTVLELGAGISGIVPCVLCPKVRRYIASDQAYVLKALQDNVTANIEVPKQRRREKVETQQNIFAAVALDWETDDIPSTLQSHGIGHGVDVVVACDCVYNYALIKPFVQACVDICQLRKNVFPNEGSLKPTVCIVAQQLRQPDVFDEWLSEFHRRFHVWRLADEMLSDEFIAGSGFAIHLGFLRSDAG